MSTMTTKQLHAIALIDRKIAEHEKHCAARRIEVGDDDVGGDPEWDWHQSEINRLTGRRIHIAGKPPAAGWTTEGDLARRVCAEIGILYEINFVRVQEHAGRIYVGATCGKPEEFARLSQSLPRGYIYYGLA